MEMETEMVKAADFLRAVVIIVAVMTIVLQIDDVVMVFKKPGSLRFRILKVTMLLGHMLVIFAVGLFIALRFGKPLNPFTPLAGLGFMLVGIASWLEPRPRRHHEQNRSKLFS